MAARTVVREPRDSQAFWMLGGLYEVRVSSEDSGGAMSVVEFTIPPGAGPPPHVHAQAELVYLVWGLRAECPSALPVGAKHWVRWLAAHEQGRVRSAG